MSYCVFPIEATIMTERLLNETEVCRLADALRALAHPLRYHMLCLLSRGEMNLQHLARGVHTSHSNAAQHLALLRAQGLVQMRKAATKVYYRLADRRTLALLAESRQLLA